MSLHDTLKVASEDALVELIQAGINMRREQREYFKFRSRDNLYKAKDSENIFDRALRSVVNAGQPTKPNLI